MGVDLLNDDLIRFQAPSGAHAEADLESYRPLGDAFPEPTPAPAPVTGLCQVCHERPGQRACLQCGAVACTQDLWVMLGLCKRCATPEEVEAARTGSRRLRPDLGIKWVQD